MIGILATVRRRRFLKSAALGTVGTLWARRLSSAAGGADSPQGGANVGPLKGFIIADAHFGWDDPRRPKPETQREMLRRILARFPDLDVFIDTGDAQHGSIENGPREEWTEIVLEGCGAIPFYYAPGNHEITGSKSDAEWQCQRMGSLPCRPYYAIDLKNIHLISLPEMMRTTYLTKESMDWLRLDLEINRDRSVLLFSHNNIRGTTSDNGEEGYRGLVNGGELLDLLKRYPNVLAWTHGHNHLYQIVEKEGKLFVSNGRFGGFDGLRKIGALLDNQLGGIYFEVDGGELRVRSFSAEKERFFDELGRPFLSRTLRVKTSFDPSAPSRVSYGKGGALDSERIPVWRHHAGGAGARELFVTGADGAVINDDPAFALFMTRNAGTPKEEKQLSAAGVTPQKTDWDWANSGVLIRANKKPGAVVVVSVPRGGQGNFMYYRCPPGESYAAELEVESGTGGQTAKMRCAVHDREGRELTALEGPAWNLKAGKQTQKAEFRIPALRDAATIYTDPTSDDVLHIQFLVEFGRLADDVIVRRFAFQRADANGPTRDACVIEDGMRYTNKGALAAGQIAHFDLPPNPPARSVYEIEAGGNRRATWLVRETGPQWQVRNAAAAESGEGLEIGPITNPWSRRREIAIAPLGARPEIWVHRLRNVNRARVGPLKDGRLKVEISEALGPAQIEICAPRAPKAVEGADTWEYKAGRAILNVGKPALVEVEFP